MKKGAIIATIAAAVAVGVGTYLLLSDDEEDER